jgi:hypothetical protein
VQRKTTSNESGDYTIPFLNPDEYTITAQKEGFRLGGREGLRTVTETISVSAAAPSIESDNSAVCQVNETKAIQDLPLNGATSCNRQSSDRE